MIAFFLFLVVVLLATLVFGPVILLAVGSLVYAILGTIGALLSSAGLALQFLWASTLDPLFARFPFLPLLIIPVLVYYVFRPLPKA